MARPIVRIKAGTKVKLPGGVRTVTKRVYDEDLGDHVLTLRPPYTIGRGKNTTAMTQERLIGMMNRGEAHHVVK